MRTIAWIAFFAFTLLAWPVTLLYAWHRRRRLARWAGIDPAAARRQERYIRGRG